MGDERESERAIKAPEKVREYSGNILTTEGRRGLPGISLSEVSRQLQKVLIFLYANKYKCTTNLFLWEFST